MKKHILILSIITIIAVLGALAILHGRGEFGSADKADQNFALEISENANDITKITLSQDDKEITLIKDEDLWSVQGREGWPADLENIRDLIGTLASSTVIEPKTTNPDLYERLGLDNSAATQVQLFNGDAVLANLFLGDRMHELDGTYARKDDEDQTYLISGSYSMGFSVDDWLDNDLFTIEQNRVRSVSINHDEVENVKIEKESKDQSDFVLRDIPKGQELSSQFEVNNIAGALRDLKLDDVKKASDFSTEANQKVQTVFQTFDGLELTINLKEHDGDLWAGFEYAFREELYEADEKEATEEEQPENMTPVPVGFETKQEIEKLKNITDGWVFKLPSYKAGLLSKKMADLTQEVEDPE